METRAQTARRWYQNPVSPPSDASCAVEEEEEEEEGDVEGLEDVWCRLVEEQKIQWAISK